MLKKVFTDSGHRRNSLEQPLTRVLPMKKIVTIIFVLITFFLPVSAYAQTTPAPRQVVVVTAANYTTHLATLTGYTVTGNKWVKTYPTVAAVVGYHGVTWNKREGDGKTPLGTYPLLFAFGYHPNTFTKMPYRQSTSEDFWVEDPTSPQYNKWVHGKPNAKSYEVMRRRDNLYEYGVVIGYNTKRIPYKGSAIFLHEWRYSTGATDGCVAISRTNIINLLKWLNPKENPEVEIEVK
jgi:L,D-peptidoglycan transpeptidase YkuD (ErfK/YbiS/YcfS/YnhG family)